MTATSHFDIPNLIGDQKHKDCKGNLKNTASTFNLDIERKKNCGSANLSVWKALEVNRKPAHSLFKKDSSSSNKMSESGREGHPYTSVTPPAMCNRVVVILSTLLSCCAIVRKPIPS